LVDGDLRAPFCPRPPKERARRSRSTLNQRHWPGWAHETLFTATPATRLAFCFAHADIVAPRPVARAACIPQPHPARSAQFVRGL